MAPTHAVNYELQLEVPMPTNIYTNQSFHAE